MGPHTRAMGGGLVKCYWIQYKICNPYCPSTNYYGTMIRIFPPLWIKRKQEEFNAEDKGKSYYERRVDLINFWDITDVEMSPEQWGEIL